VETKSGPSRYPCVSLMGCSMSGRQEQLLPESFSYAKVMLDGNEAGRQGTDELLQRVGRRVWVKAPCVPDGKQPDQLSVEILAALLK
jgi:hypothetical protein